MDESERLINLAEIIAARTDALRKRARRGSKDLPRRLSPVEPDASCREVAMAAEALREIGAKIRSLITIRKTGG